MSEAMWTRSNGQKVPIASMNDHHLKSAIAMMQRNGYVSARAVQDALFGGRPNGEGAQDAFDKECEGLFDGVPSELLDSLNDELVRRQGPDYLGFEREEVQF